MVVTTCLTAPQSELMEEGEACEGSLHAPSCTPHAPWNACGGLCPALKDDDRDGMGPPGGRQKEEVSWKASQTVGRPW